MKKNKNQGQAPLKINPNAQPQREKMNDIKPAVNRETGSSQSNSKKQR